MAIRLIVTAGPDAGAAFELQPGETLQVGRSPASGTKLTDPAVSRAHCDVEVGPDRAVMHNLSPSGTLVNGKAAAEHTLRHGDVLRVGDTELRYEAPGAATLPFNPPAADEEPDATQSLVGKTIENYAVEELITRGASGTIYRARDVRDGQVVALKVLDPALTQSDADLQLFVRAMKGVLSVRHANLVSVLGAGKTGTLGWIAMQYVDGESLAERLHRAGGAPGDWRDGWRIGVHVARALEHAHGLSILHRNVTPSNVLVRRSDGAAVLGDLMLAKALESTPAGAGRTSKRRMMVSLARQVDTAGERLDELAYLSPERTRDATTVDARSDVYGLGATLYAALTGRPPFVAESFPELVQAIRAADPQPVSKHQPASPAALQELVARLLAKSPDARPGTVREVLRELERIGTTAGLTA